jgi:hypothetical protein
MATIGGGPGRFGQIAEIGERGLFSRPQMMRWVVRVDPPYRSAFGAHWGHGKDGTGRVAAGAGQPLIPWQRGTPQRPIVEQRSQCTFRRHLDHSVEEPRRYINHRQQHGQIRHSRDRVEAKEV